MTHYRGFFLIYFTRLNVLNDVNRKSRLRILDRKLLTFGLFEKVPGQIITPVKITK